MKRVNLAASSLWALAAGLLSACEPSPIGSWTGTDALVADDGESFYNTLEVDADSAETAWYFVDLNPDYDPEDEQSPEWMIFELSMEAEDWTVVHGIARFDFEVSRAGVSYENRMTCEFEYPGMRCDADPAFYEDDEAVLQWVLEP